MDLQIINNKALLENKIKNFENEVLEYIISTYRSDIYIDIQKNGITLNNLGQVLDAAHKTYVSSIGVNDNYYEKYNKIRLNIHEIIRLKKELYPTKIINTTKKDKSIWQKILECF